MLVLGADAPSPPGKGQVRVRMAWAGINPADWKVLRGQYKLISRGAFPRFAGAEGSGVVTELGPGVAGFTVGQRVAIGLLPTYGLAGTWAHEAQVPASRLFSLPDALSLRDAAVLPIAGLTAYQMCEKTRVGPGMRVLVTGGSGGVGSFAVQIAKARGARVTATGSAPNRACIEALGADDFIDYRECPMDRVQGQWDAVLDCVNTLRSRSAALLTPRGGYVDTDPHALTMLKDALGRLGGGQHRHTAAVGMDHLGMRVLSDLLVTGRARALIGMEHAFESLPQALQASLNGHSLGKHVVRIGGQT